MAKALFNEGYIALMGGAPSDHDPCEILRVLRTARRWLGRFRPRGGGSSRSEHAHRPLVGVPGGGQSHRHPETLGVLREVTSLRRCLEEPAARQRVCRRQPEDRTVVDIYDGDTNTT